MSGGDTYRDDGTIVLRRRLILILSAQWVHIGDSLQPYPYRPYPYPYPWTSARTSHCQGAVSPTQDSAKCLYSRQREIGTCLEIAKRTFCGASSWVLTATCFSSVQLRSRHRYPVRRGDCFFHGRSHSPRRSDSSHVAAAADGYYELLRAV